jgi:limonene-1,2-epoxide hydrolase
MDPEKTVRQFCDAVTELDVQKLLGFFTEDAVYHNIPIDPVHGREAVGVMLGQFLGPATTKAEFEILAIASSGGTVMTERIDRFEIGGKSVALPVMGTFEVTSEGAISAWRDYFDMAQFTSQMG